MGMFDYVDFECKCPNCGAYVDGFQTKNSNCELDTLKPWIVNNFYSSCSECGAWIEYTRKEIEEKEGWLEEFDLSVDLPDEDDEDYEEFEFDL